MMDGVITSKNLNYVHSPGTQNAEHFIITPRTEYLNTRVHRTSPTSNINVIRFPKDSEVTPQHLKALTVQ